MGTLAGTAPSGYAYQFNAGRTELDLTMLPEPSTWMAGGLVIILAGVSRRHQIGGWLGFARA